MAPHVMAREAWVLSLFLLMGVALRAQDETRELQEPLVEPEIPPPPNRDGLEFNLNPPQWLGIAMRGNVMSGEGRLDVPNGFVAQSNGITQPLTSEIEYFDKQFEAVGVGLVSDYDLFRLSFDFYVGEWDGDARLTVDDRLVPPKVTDLEVEGDFYAFRFTGTWPLLRARTGGFEASLGPALSVGWHRSKLESPMESPVVISDEITELIGTIGPRLSIRLKTGGLEVSAEAETSYLFSSTRGTFTEASVGFGLSW